MRKREKKSEGDSGRDRQTDGDRQTDADTHTHTFTGARTCRQQAAGSRQAGRKSDVAAV